MTGNILVLVFILAITWSTVNSLRCASCIGSTNCYKDYKDIECSEQERETCYVIVRGINDKFPLQMGCTRNCESDVIPNTSFDKSQCSACNEDNCNKSGEFVDNPGEFGAASRSTISILAPLLSVAVLIAVRLI